MVKPTDILDLSVPSSADDSRKNQRAAMMMSEEECRIRGELENEIERDLEEEIKDGIYHLALRLHRLYQHRRERKIAKQLKLKHKVDKDKPSESGDIYDHNKDVDDKALSELNISIKMDGATKIEIKESKKQVPADYQKGLSQPQPQPLPPRRWSSSPYRSNRTVQSQGRLIGSNVTNKNKFDWANSLRAGAGPVVVNRKIVERSDQAKMASNEKGLAMNYNINLENTRRNNVVRTSGQRKGNPSIDNKHLELGWKC